MTEAPEVPDATFLSFPMAGCWWDQPAAGLGGRAAHVIGRARGACGICLAWLIGLPRRAGARLYAATDAEARWWQWEVTEPCGGLVRRYRDTRFAALRQDPGLRRDEPRELASPGSAAPDCPCAGDR